jgi:hypothetical protein
MRAPPTLWSAGSDWAVKGRWTVMVPGKRYQVFSVKERRIDEKDKDKDKGQERSTWVKAGSAWVNRDGSINVYLDVLPLDGKLHVREALDKRDTVEPRNTSTNGSPTMELGVAGGN